MAAKVKALQMWCKKQCEGYRDVDVTNMTSSFKSGLAFCAIIHRFRPDLIDYDSLSKENVFDNNKLAFDVAHNELGIAALLDAEDMVAMRVPDKLCIVTYVAQYANYFRDQTPAGGPGVKQKVATKRHTPKENVEPVREAKRPTPDATVKQWKPTAPSGGHVEASAKRDTFGDKCAMCGKKVYVLERHFEGTTLYHRRCIRGSQRAASFGKAGETNGQTGREEFGKKEKENRVPPNGPSSLLIQVNGGPKPYVSAREDEGKKSDTNGTTGTSSLLSKLRGPAPYKGEAAMTPPKARQVDVQKTDWNKFLGVSAPGKTGHTRGVEKMDVDDDVPPPLPLSKQPPKKPPRMLETSSTVVEKAQTAPVERFKRVTEEEPKTAKKDTRMLHEKPENAAVLSGLLKSLSHVRHDGSPGTSGPHAGSQAATSQFTLIKTTSPVSKPDIKKRNDDSHITLTHTTGKPTPFGSVEQSGTSKSDTIGSVATKKVDSSQALKAKINTFEHAKDGSESKGRDSPAFCSSYKTTGQKPASSVPVSVESAKSSKRPQLNSYLKSTSGNDKLNKRPTVIRPPASILKNGSNNSQAQRTQPNGVDHRDSEDVNTTSVTESHVKTHGPDTQVVAGNNFSAFNINDSVELDSSKSSGKGEGKEREKKEEREKNGEREEREQTGKKEERKQKGEREGKGEKAVRGKPTWQVEVEARGGKIPRQQVPKHGKKELGGGDAAGSETDWQREARRREAARGGRYADPEKKQVHIIKASPSKNSPEPEQMGSPAERTGSPAEHIGSPAERTRSPAERTGLLAEHTGSPAERTGSPAERMGSPAERTGSPAERMGSPKTTHLKRGEVFYIKEKTVGDVSPRPVDKDKTVEKESPGKTDWQLEAERRQSNQRHKDEATCPTPAPRNISRPTPGVSTELARPPSESVVVDKPARVRVKPRAVKTQWYVDAEKRKTTASGVDPGKTVEYTEVIIENGSDRIERPYVIGSVNRVKYTDVTVTTKKKICPETRFSFNFHDFKPPAEGAEPVNPVKSPPARPPTLPPSRKTRRAPLPPTIIRPAQTPKRTVNAERRMSPIEICRQLREIDVELRDLEAEGRDLETQIRSGTDDEMDTSEELMVQWFGLINQRNELVRKEADLMYRQKQQELEGIHEDVEYELRCLMDKPDHQKTETERTREAVLLQELLETVNMRNSIVDSMEEDRIRYIEEDQEIAEVLGMKHLGADAQPSSKADAQPPSKADTQPPSKADTKPQKPTKKHQKTNGFIQPMAAVR